MKTFLVGVVVRGHRALFTAATAALGVTGSLLASDGSCVGNWLMVAGAASIMYVEDLCGEIDRDARVLAKTNQQPLRSIRVDVFSSRRPLLLSALLVLGAGAIAVGGVARS